MNILSEDRGDYSARASRQLRIPASCAGRRLDQALAEMLPEHSRNRLQGWVRDGRVQVDGLVRSEPKFRVLGGEAVVIDEEVEDDVDGLPEDIPISIVFEDEALLVIDKPAGLVVHPGSGNRSGTLMNALLHHVPGIEAVPRAGIVHRLDKDTSGLLVVAKTLVAQTDLVRQLQARTVKRQYLAVACGRIGRDGLVDAPIARHPTQRIKMAVVRGGKPAVTHYRVVQAFANATLVECSLETGRTHQIRVHMASLGHPLLGDPVYGKKLPGLPPFGRQALHARRLGLIHPLTGAALAWESPLPGDFEQLLKELCAP